MLSRWVRTWYSILLRPMLLLLAHLGITPTMLTASSLVLMVITGGALSQRQSVLGGVFLLLGGILDGIDGELARVMDHETKLGAFLDSICDHCGDYAVFFGLLWWYLQIGSFTEVVLIFLALFGSMLGSQVRSRAGMVGIDLKDIGLFTRFERNTLLILGLFTHWLLAILWVLAVLNNVTALQRIIHTLRIAHAGEVPGQQLVELPPEGK
jgi:phosphatidylglycerophosphate synthase